MTWRWYYSVDASTVLEITDRVRLPMPDGDGTPASVGSHAEEGSGWVGNIEVDDPDGDLMLLMHRRIYSTQDAEAAGSQVVGNWFISDLDVVRMDPWSGAARKWIVSMADENSLLSRRIFQGTGNDRPAETDIARIRWLLTTTELNTVDKDEAFIDTVGPVDMDACDYIGQKPESVMSDVSQQSGKNYWIKYGEAAAVGGAIVSSSVAAASVITTTSAHGLTTGMSVVIAGHSGSTPDINGTHVVTVTGASTFTIPVNVTVGGTGGTTTTIGRYQLCYFNANTSELYPSAISLSNVASEIDSSTVFAISDDARLSRAGGRAPTSGVYLPYTGGYVYTQDTDVGDTYVYRDVAAPSNNVKTPAKATTRATRMLAELDEPDDEVGLEIVVEEAQVNDAMHGMLIPLHATHFPNYTASENRPGYVSGTNMRIMRRQVRQIGPTTFGNRMWLTPVTPSCVGEQFYQFPSPGSEKSVFMWELSGVTTTPTDSLRIEKQDSSGTFDPGTLTAAGTEAELMLMFGFVAGGYTDSDGPGGFNLGGNFASTLLTIDHDLKQQNTYLLPESVGAHRLLTSPTAGEYGGALTYGGFTRWGAAAYAFAGTGITIVQSKYATGEDGTDQLFITLDQPPVGGNLLVAWVVARSASMGAGIGLPTGFTGLATVYNWETEVLGAGGRLMYHEVECQ